MRTDTMTAVSPNVAFWFGFPLYKTKYQIWLNYEELSFVPHILLCRVVVRSSHTYSSAYKHGKHSNNHGCIQIP